MNHTVKRALALMIALLLALPVLAFAEDAPLPADDVPVADAPIADAPVADAPVADAPIADAPVADAAVADTPATEETVATETEEVSVEENVEAPDAGAEAPVEEILVAAPAEPEVAEASEQELTEDIDAEAFEAEADAPLWESFDDVPAEDAVPEETLAPVTEVVGAGWDDGDNDQLLDAYVQQMIDDSLGLPAALPLFAASATLTGMDGIVYDILKSRVTRVAEGALSNTVFVITEEELRAEGIDLGPWTAASLGVSSVVYDGGINPEALNAVKAVTAFSTDKVINALLADCPSELYWYNKTKGLSMNIPGMTVGATWNGTEYELCYKTAFSITISMSVSKAYQNSGEYTVSADRVSTARRAIATAQGIVQSHSSGSVLDRLTAYKNEICERVDYNHAAAGNGEAYGDPWQMIYVFDGDPSTKVVCEGYSKAFKYLFDLSGFSDAYDCLLAIGTMNGGGHMWNIVRMEDGRNYLVDVTNCDSSSGPTNRLFMSYGPAGSLNGGYTFTPGGSSITYVYSDKARATFSDAQLTLSDIAYNAVQSDVSVRGGIAHGTVSASLTRAWPGESVAVTVTPDAGYALVENSLVYRYNDGAAQTRVIGDGRCFSMPAAPVTIDAEFRLIPATAPTISAQPTALSMTYGSTRNSALHVGVSPIDGHTLSYQWYSNRTNSASGGTAIGGATAADYSTEHLGIGTTYCYCTVTATRNDNGQTATATTRPVSVRIAKAPLTVTAKPHAITYGDAPANAGVTYAGFVNGESASALGGTLGYQYSYTRYGDAGSAYTITPKGLTSGNYDITFVPAALTVNPKPLGLNWSDTSLTFNGASQAPKATLTGIVNGDDVSVAVTGGRTDAGTGYTATATLKGARAGNYALPANSAKTFSIGKALKRTLEDVAMSRPFAVTAVEATVDGRMPGNAGKLTYAKGTATVTGSVKLGSWRVDAATGAVTAAFSGGAVGDTLTLPVIISSANYADSTIRLVVRLIAKADAGVTIAQGSALTAYYGDTLKLSASAANTGDGGVWTWSSSNSALPVSNTGAVTVGSTGKTAVTARYSSATTEGSATLVLTVRPKSIAGGTLSLSQTRFAHDGAKKRVTATLTLNGKALTGADYDISGDLAGTAAGLYTVTATGKGNYADSLSATWSIAAVTDPSALTPAQKPAALYCTYTGSGQALLTPPAELPEGYAQVLYSLDDGASWSAAIPTAAASGEYAIRVKYVGDALHMDFEGDRLVANIQRVISPPAPETPVYNPPAADTGAPAVEQEPSVVTISAPANVKAPAVVGKVYQIDLGGKAGKGFKSSNKKVASVTSGGQVTPKKPGKAKITFKVGRKKRTVTLTVTDPTIPKHITLTASGSLTGKKGGTVQLTASLPEGTNSAIRWTSGNNKVATVNADGLVTFKKPGRATITATCKRGGKKAKVKVRVTK